MTSYHAQHGPEPGGPPTRPDRTDIRPAAVATNFVPGRGREAIEKQAASSPLRNVTEADDVALAVRTAVTGFRLSTGTNLVVDGGRHL